MTVILVIVYWLLIEFCSQYGLALFVASQLLTAMLYQLQVHKVNFSILALASSPHVLVMLIYDSWCFFYHSNTVYVYPLYFNICLQSVLFFYLTPNYHSCRKVHVHVAA